MDDPKTISAGHHDEAARNFEVAAKLHRDAAKQCSNGNYEKGQTLATSAAEAETLANRHAVDALDFYSTRTEEVAGQKAELAAEEAARAAKHEAKEAG